MKLQEASDKKGFTLVELLIVAAIGLVVAAASFPLVENVSSRRTLDAEAFELVQFLRNTRVRSIAGLDDASWGIILEADRYTVYQTPGDFDLVIKMEENISISSTIVGNDIAFEKTTGNPLPIASGAVSITLTDAQGERRIIEINELGIISLL